MGGLSEEGRERLGVGCFAERVADPFVAHQPRDGRQRVEVADAAGLGRDETEDQVHRHPVGRGEVDRLVELEQRGDRAAQSVDAGVRNRHSAPEPGAAETFALLQPLEHHRAVEAVALRESLGEEFENRLLRFRRDYLDGRRIEQEMSVH